MYKKLMNKIICFVLAVSLVINYSNVVFAKENDTMNIDGYDIEVIQEKENDIKAKVVENGVEYIVNFDMSKDEYSLKTKEKETILSEILNINNEIETQEIIIDNASETKVEGKVLDGEKTEGFKIDQNDEQIVAQAPLVVGGGAALVAALIKAIVATGAIVVVGGSTWYIASKVISRLKRDQPNIRYYAARLSGGNVLIKYPIKSKSAAASRLESGSSVFAISSGYAYSACKRASPIRKVSKSQKHGSGRQHYKHFHPMKKTKQQMDAHCWFI